MKKIIMPNVMRSITLFSAVLSVGSMALPLAVLADDSTTPDSNDTTNTSYNADYSDSDKKIADATAKGMKITETTKTVTVKTKAEAEKAQEQAKKDKATQDAALDKAISSYNEWSGGNTGINGVKPGDINQQLIMKKEPNAKTDINLTNDSVMSKKLTPEQMNSGTTELPRGINPGNSDIKSTYGYYVHSKSGTKGASGNLGTITYSNLENTTYNGKKVSKIEMDLSDLGDNPLKNPSWAPGVIIFQDPTDTIWNIQTQGTSYTYRFYDEDGNKIDFKDKTAFFTIGSLNAGYGDANRAETATGDTNSPHFVRETVQVVGGSADMFKLEGSSVTVHDDNKAYSDASNTAIGGLSDPNHVIPSSWAGWDSTDASNRIVGASLIGFKEGVDPQIRFATDSDGSSDDSYDQWGTVSTTIDPSRPAPTAGYEKTNIVVKGVQTDIKKSFVSDTSSWKLTKVTDAGSESSSSSNAESNSATATSTASTDQTSDTSTTSTTDNSKSSSETSETNNVELGKAFGYTLNTTIDSFDSKGNPVTKFGMVDNLAAPLSLDGIQIVDKTDGDKDITADFDLTGKVSANIKSDKLAALDGHNIEERIASHIDPNADLSQYKQDDGSYKIGNVANKLQNDDNTPSNNIDVLVPKTPVAPKAEEPAKDLPNTGTTNKLAVLWNKLVKALG